MDERIQLLEERLTRGLTKAEAKRVAKLIVNLYHSVDEIVPSPKLDKVVTCRISAESRQLGELTYIKIKEFIESTGYNFKIPDAPTLSETIDKIHRLDGKSYDEIQSLITYLYEIYTPKGEFDWRMQIRSGSALRRHWEKIVATMSQDYRLHASRAIADV